MTVFPPGAVTEAARIAQDPDEHVVGVRAPELCRLAGITYRQCDYWTRVGYIVADVRDAAGSGTQRLYSAEQVDIAAVIADLLHAGVELPAAFRIAMDLRDDRVVPLTDRLYLVRVP